MNIKDKVTQHVIDGLEKGQAPWVRGWSDDGTKSTLCLAPRNGYSQRPYSGINWLILGMFNKYTSNEWFTARNAIKMTGNPKPIPYDEFKDSTKIVWYDRKPCGKDKDGEEQF